MKKKFMLVLLLFSLLVGLSPRSITQAQTTNTQGDQFEQGKYDLQAEFPFGRNWNKNSPYVGTDVTKVKWEHKVYYSEGAFNRKIQPFDPQVAIGRDGTVYASNQNFKLYAFNKDGSVKWIKADVTNTGIPPVIAEDGTIYVAGVGITALNPDGTIKWQDKTPIVHQALIIDNDGTIYVRNIIKGRLEAYNPDGSMKWASAKFPYGVDKADYMVLSKNGTLYILDRNSLYAYDKNGKQLWEKTVGGDVHHPPGTLSLGLNDEILITDGNNLCVFDKDGNLLHTINTGTEELSAEPIISTIDGTIYMGAGRYLYAYNPDYTLKWKYDVQDRKAQRVRPQVVDKNGVIYCFGGNFEMFVFNPDGTLKWSFPLTEELKTFGGGITIDKDGTLYTTSSGVRRLKGEWYPDTYYSIMAIGDDYTDNACTKEST
ncbi:PQQ-binding-like beta-propeller repeat protein, partial [Bacillus sp. JJ864]|uniref:PQQ-binding-like beta-propeller repeat protein n=1 Tax=Bacillus sp. JJ864 TaxID=3122975 RepID=UPI002FFF5AB0